MKNNTITSYKSNDNVNNQLAIIKELKLQDSQNGTKYYSVIFQDKTGTIPGKIWEDKIHSIANIDKMGNGEVVLFSGKIQEYKGSLQVIISDIVPATDYNLAELTLTGKRDTKELWDTLQNFKKRISNLEIIKILDSVFDEETKSRYCEASAAANFHHAFVGGLLEHVVEMLELSVPYQSWYQNADFDIIWSGIILHDIGKIFELQKEGLGFKFSTQGKMIGHINLGIEFVKSKIPQDTTYEIWMQIQHIMISHHRELEYGAAVTPCSIEAAVVSICDLGSSWVRQFDQILEESKNSINSFSEYKKPIGSIYLGNKSNSNMIEKSQTENEDIQLNLI
jgi:3'-5' exoribonuclease